ncbi:MAG: SpoIID/LytB domain-containing protein [Ignavibacteriae bacterium]|nr:SpoIID/LytB domain-containing protein [Ignavibacteriota bacterium]MCB9207986.1 SpoIID/LytB domain-containing protein [Ignavibacteriales bacterium]MCB9258755.1 SpoIID/LytB domain-containing protein [Ignavibacteriales bacterium]
MKQPNVNVAIMSSKEVAFILYGDFKSTEFSDNFNGNIKAEFADGMIRLKTLTKEYKSVHEIIFNPVDPQNESFLLKGVTIGLQFHWEQKQNQRFSGSLKIIVENENLTVINIVPVEQYLTSVISSEMSATSSLELLKAHAIISRSWLLAQIEKRKNVEEHENYSSEFINENEIIRWYDREDHLLYDVCADDHCQRYQGITKSHAHNAEQAVQETSGFVLMDNDQICDARFSKSCGGITETFENVWEKVEHPYLKTIIDYKYDPDGYNYDLRNENDAEKWILSKPPAFCNTNDEKILDQVLNNYDRKTRDFYRWKVEYTQDEISKLINKKTQIDFGNIIDLIPVERGYSGRLIKMNIIGNNKSLIIGKELEIRKVLSDSHLYSSAFIIKKENIVENIPQKFILIGSGWGHGVGLCQIGAAVMGEKGYNFDEILLHYFRGASIKKIYD